MASKEMWSVRTLDRNISTQYYERHFATPQLSMSAEKPDKLELLKSPIVAEFLGFKNDYSFSEDLINLFFEGYTSLYYFSLKKS